ncbi:SLC13 family permease [Oceanibacterium hippocampi]|uniref:Inner membrane protein YbhI n=1 Tax=Oceanibacterium hippocampi TaxID=745714 RepID=A0A1Y5SHI0_9PROT|nr:SLC13 family permease [Oceanibacterium hippocampi]SLN40818.1 Inner membrane protein YbhI [Oceanibacterium hippocampi]
MRVGLPGALSALSILVAVWFFVAPPDGLPPETARAFGLSLAAIGFWATGSLPEHITVIGFFLAAMLLAVAPPDVVFSGFTSSAFWLVFGGMLLGASMGHTGLGARIAGRLAGLLGGTYGGAVAGMIAAGIGLAFLMPSTMARLMLLLPIVNALAEAMGFERGSRGATGLTMATAVASFLPAFAILPATVPALVLMGTSETLFGIQQIYGTYLFTHFPVLGVLKCLLIWLIVMTLFRTPAVSRAEPAAAGPMSRAEKRLGIVLALALGFWLTDFLHGISPAWVALGAGFVCLLPGTDLLPKDVFTSRINFAPLLYVAGILGLGGVVAYSGVGGLLAESILGAGLLAPGADAQNFAVIAAAAAGLNMVATIPGSAAVMTPLAGEFAAASGLSISAVFVMQMSGFSTLLLPYQGAPVVVAMQLNQVSLGDAARVTVTLALCSVLILWPLQYLWMVLLGLLA